MRITQILVIVLLVALFSDNVLGVSITYNGLKCRDAVNINDPTFLEIPIQSRFQVTEDVGNGIFRLNLTGGLPRFVNDNQNVCIDSDTAIGFSGIPAVDGLPRRLNSISAVAYFDGRDLIITVNSIHSDLSAGRSAPSTFSTSFILPISNTLILEYNPQGSSFRLKKLIHNRGLVHTSGSTNSLIPFFETVLPFFNNSTRDEPRILIPVSNIEYILE